MNFTVITLLLNAVFRTVLVESSTGREIFNIDLPRTQQIVFSPRDRLLAVYEPYVSYIAKTVRPANFYFIAQISEPSYILHSKNQTFSSRIRECTR